VVRLSLLACHLRARARRHAFVIAQHAGEQREGTLALCVCGVALRGL
jgi:hypothetical protein